MTIREELESLCRQAEEFRAGLSAAAAVLERETRKIELATAKMQASLDRTKSTT